MNQTLASSMSLRRLLVASIFLPSDADELHGDVRHLLGQFSILMQRFLSLIA